MLFSIISVYFSIICQKLQIILHGPVSRGIKNVLLLYIHGQIAILL